MEYIENQSFQNEILSVDDKVFVSCHFRNCILLYSGGEFNLAGTRVQGCTWRFNGAAYRTLNVLQTFELSADDSELHALSVC